MPYPPESAFKRFLDTMRDDDKASFHDATISVMDTAEMVFRWMLEHDVPRDAQALAAFTKMILDRERELRTAPETQGGPDAAATA